MTLLIGLLLLGALFFHAVAAIGVVRLPDFFARLHAVSAAETLGTLLVLAAVGAAAGPGLLWLKLVLVGGFFFLANPTSTHALARAALRIGLEPWRREPRAEP